MSDTKSCAVCAVGLKGAEFLAGLATAGVLPSTVYSYDQADDASRSFGTIRRFCETNSVAFYESRSPDLRSHSLVFLVGWQFLIPGVMKNCVVFHDSLLPRYRGFSPTVTALIKGQPFLGVTAITPTEETDAGPIVGQLQRAITYPCRIDTALRLQSELMVTLAIGILERTAAGEIDAIEQDQSQATFSIWRDKQDYVIDWTRSAAEIRRFVDATSYPYDGASTSLAGEKLIVDRATELPDVRFEIRQPGKVWNMEDGCPVVVCGEGLLRLERVLTSNGQPYAFSRMRLRFE